MGQTQFRSDDTVKWWLGFGNGSDGDYSSVGNATDAPIDSSCSGTAASTSLSATNASFANGKPILIHQTRGTGAGNWELNQIASYTAGTITLKKALQNTYTDSGASQAQVIQLKQYNNFTQNSGHTLTAKAWDGNIGGIIAFLAKGTCTVNGTLGLNGRNANASSATVNATNGGGFRGGRGANNCKGTGDNAYQGEGTGGSGGASTAANGNGGGAGTGDDHQGGGGGHAGIGGSGLGGGGGGGGNGTGGGAAGNAALTSMVFGGGGGGGTEYGNEKCSSGANGGGMAFIFANDISITGTVNANGGAGVHDGGDGKGIGGGGAGGSVLLKCQTASLGSNKILAGGGGGVVSVGTSGGGSVGRIHLDYSGSYTGTTSPTLDATLDPTIKAGGPNFFAFF